MASATATCVAMLFGKGAHEPQWAVLGQERGAQRHLGRALSALDTAANWRKPLVADHFSIRGDGEHPDAVDLHATLPFYGRLRQ